MDAIIVWEMKNGMYNQWLLTCLKWAFVIAALLHATIRAYESEYVLMRHVPMVEVVIFGSGHIVVV